jgi:hypothetical protein
MIANTNRDPKRRPFSAVDFHPMESRSRPRGTPLSGDLAERVGDMFAKRREG